MVGQIGPKFTLRIVTAECLVLHPFICTNLDALHLHTQTCYGAEGTLSDAVGMGRCQNKNIFDKLVPVGSSKRGALTITIIAFFECLSDSIGVQ